MPFRFRKHQHLLKSVEFKNVFDQRTSVADGNLIVYVISNGRPFSRLGMSVSRKVGNAIVRNWWKRRIRESFRLSQDKLPSGVDLVIIPRRRNHRPSFEQIHDSMTSLVHRADRKLKRLASS